MTSVIGTTSAISTDTTARLIATTVSVDNDKVMEPEAIAGDNSVLIIGVVAGIVIVIGAAVVAWLVIRKRGKAKSAKADDQELAQQSNGAKSMVEHYSKSFDGGGGSGEYLDVDKALSLAAEGHYNEHFGKAGDKAKSSEYVDVSTLEESLNL